MAAGTVVVTGVSGYLGQFLAQDLAASGYRVGGIYRTGEAPQFDEAVQVFKADLGSGEGLRECLAALGPLTAVINCAAMAAPAAVEADPEGGRAVNVPTALLDALEQHAQQGESSGGGGRPLPFLIHISTDHVYDGASTMYKEDAELRPVNTYGRQKVEGERLVQARWPAGRRCILRPSIIYGPPPRNAIRRGLFLQYIDASLADKKPTTFFADEWRTPTYVKDLVAACRAVLGRSGAAAAAAAQGSGATTAEGAAAEGASTGGAGSTPLPAAEAGAAGGAGGGGGLPAGRDVYNVGGPWRMNRVDMALAVAEVRGYDPALVLPGLAGSVPRTCATPEDISMDCLAAQEELGVKLTPFSEALREIFAQS